MDRPLWVPSPERIARANLTRFVDLVNRERGAGVHDYATLYRWSIERPSDFWTAVWDFAGVIGTRGTRVAVDSERMRPGAHFFPDAHLNFAENALRRRGPEPSIVFRNERGDTGTWSCDELTAQASAFAASLRSLGARPGDRVAGFVPNLPEAIAAGLGPAAVGAVWSSCSPDFGVPGVLDRFGQIAPKVLVAAGG